MAIERMNQDVKRRWIEALLSGEYKQGQGALRIVDSNDSEYCCLGVLCDLYSKENGVEWDTVLTNHTGTVGFMRELSFLPGKVREWADLATSNAQYNGADPDANLSVANDNGSTFEEIVKIIEEYF